MGARVLPSFLSGSCSADCSTGRPFFAGALAIVEAVDLARRKQTLSAALWTLVLSATVIVTLDLAHLALAGQGSLSSFRAVLEGAAAPVAGRLLPEDFAFGQLDTTRRYFTHTGLGSGALVSAALFFPRGRLASALRFENPVLVRLLAATGGAAAAYVVAAPRWADVHPYWKFYALPFVVLSVTFVAHALAGSRAPRDLVRGVALAAGLEILLTSVYMLHLRHTRVGAHAVEETANLRRSFLRPKSAPAP